MATISSAFNDTVLYNNWISDDSEHENELLYNEGCNSVVEGDESETEVENCAVVEFDGTSPDTKYFLSENEVEQFSCFQEDSEDDEELEQYVSDLVTIHNFDFSSVHIPESSSEVSDKLNSQWIYPDTISQQDQNSTNGNSLLFSGDSEPEFNQVMSDSIHLIQNESSLIPGGLVNNGVTIPSETLSSFQENISVAFNSINYCPISNLILSDNQFSENENKNEVTGIYNSPTKQQQQVVSDQSENRFKHQTPRKNKRKRTFHEVGIEFPQDIEFSDESSEEEDIGPQSKRRRLSQKYNPHQLALPNLVLKKYLIALKDPRFMPQFYDRKLYKNFFAHEKVLRIIDDETEDDVEIV